MLYIGSRHPSTFWNKKLGSTYKHSIHNHFITRLHIGGKKFMFCIDIILQHIRFIFKNNGGSF